MRPVRKSQQGERRAPALRRAVLAATCLLLLVVPSAYAAGGSDIASAPTVAFGQSQSGNTTTDSGSDGSCFSPHGYGNSWWNLPVSTGDKITIDMAGQTEGDGFNLRVYPSGTNDFNVSNSTEPYAENEQADSSEVKFTAPSDGVMPMDISTCDSLGTYSFTAYLTHPKPAPTRYKVCTKKKRKHRHHGQSKWVKKCHWVYR
ncbi:MAG: hypothetical protein QOG34_1284 [Frankiaceae bacterium]|jgi:hypothetical protein|nr:hypothetical protein [Frankiaceae bacterium]